MPTSFKPQPGATLTPSHPSPGPGTATPSTHQGVRVPTSQQHVGVEPSFWDKYRMRILLLAGGAAGAGMFGNHDPNPAQPGGLQGFLGDGAVIGGIPAGMPGAVSNPLAPSDIGLTGIESELMNRAFKSRS